MTRYAARRLLASLPLLGMLTVLCFALLHAAPGGPLGAVDPRQRGADRARLERTLGLDAPLPVQYGRWLAGILRGDLGRSLTTGEPVGGMILARLPATLELMGASLALSLAVGMAMGVLAALRRGTAVDHVLRSLAVAGVSIPVFWLGVLSLLVFAAGLGWLPAGGRASLGAPPSLADHLRHLVLPAGVLACVQAPMWARHVRASLLEVLAEDWVRAARARGLPSRRVLLRHALRPALVPAVTLLGLQAPALFTGAAITETVFGWPGIGQLFHDATVRFDYPRLMAILLLAAVLVVVCNLAADLAAARLDPRLRGGR